jgi:hypothetical protein
VTKPDFLDLFAPGTPLQQAASEWWDAIASCGHPKSRLWFRHWGEETRAHPTIAQAFGEAVRLGLDKPGGARGYLACEVFERLYEACRDGRCSSHLLGICAGPSVGDPEANADAVTFLNARLAPEAPDVQVEKNVRQQLAAAEQHGLWWLTPRATVPGGLRQDATDIRLIRDRLGLAHWQSDGVKVAVVWHVDVTRGARIPSMCDGRWAFWRPAPAGARWGATLDLTGGQPGLPEAVIRRTAQPAEPARDGGKLCRWVLDHAYPGGPDGRYAALCEQLLKQ